MRVRLFGWRLVVTYAWVAFALFAVLHGHSVHNLNQIP